MLMTMGVLNKHDYKHEFITPRQKNSGITEGIKKCSCQIIKENTYNIHSYIINKIQTHITFKPNSMHDPF